MKKKSLKAIKGKKYKLKRQTDKAKKNSDCKLYLVTTRPHRLSKQCLHIASPMPAYWSPMPAYWSPMPVYCKSNACILQVQCLHIASPTHYNHHSARLENKLLPWYRMYRINIDRLWTKYKIVGLSHVSSCSPDPWSVLVVWAWPVQNEKVKQVMGAAYLLLLTLTRSMTNNYYQASAMAEDPIIKLESCRQ